jgi:hypothetical protein
VCATFLGYFVEQWEPIAWAEEIIPHAKAARHPRLAQLCAGASYCAALGRNDDFVGHAEAAQAAIESGQYDDVGDELACAIAAGYNTAGQPELAVRWCRERLARHPGPHVVIRAILPISLTIAGAIDEAMDVSTNAVAAAERTGNPVVTAAALLGYGWARRDTDPAAAYAALRRAWSISEQSGNRQQVSINALLMSRLAATHGELAQAIDHIIQTIRHYHDSGSFELMLNAFGVLAVLLDGLGHHESAATVSGFASAALARTAFPEIDLTITHLREVLGDDSYESFARAGANMTNTEMVAYAFDQIDRARADLPLLSESP